MILMYLERGIEVKLFSDGTVEGTPEEIKRFLDLQSVKITLPSVQNYEEKPTPRPSWTPTDKYWLHNEKMMFVDYATQPKSAGSVTL